MTRRELLAGMALAAGGGLAAGCVGITRDSRAPVDLLRPGTWTRHRPMGDGRQEIAVAALGDRLIVIGGFGELGTAVGTVEAYRPATDAWETLAPLPAPVHHPAAAVGGGRLFVLGGYADRVPPWRAQRTVYEYDPARNSWATRAPLLIARGGHAAATVPAADRWSRLASMPTARDHLAAVAFQGRLWAIGGRSSFLGDQYAHVEIYDASTDRWHAGTPLPEGRGGLAAVAVDDRIFVFGGESPLRIWSATEMYEVAGNRWIAKEPMPTPRHGMGAAVLDGRIWIPGGGTRPGLARTSVNEAYRP